MDVSTAGKSPSLREDFFGAHDEDDALFAVGREIGSKPPQQGEPENSCSPSLNVDEDAPRPEPTVSELGRSLC